ncbi:hypothetical protein A3F19_01780 [Candidatus Nomurabacteria bacterium RIFCSPHIGHO2_12_FULL_37_29]|uniref:UDP-N-acetylmuramate--L-alanine ligase n=1 Tax=Candidatus Nomurabacteria bacterium RIFCSPHIGHO2_12_FULL_37_29 TaxID=1801759 RepID=A0A1F6W9T0_9BACT|nr:MAG: hypothetical protein A3F19_01780 [Candidatus Nomurabacteria bacterium RIFCSPHIGHO2_12_FULL_37_29]OGI84359.1 MAG: hypothetical protein A3A92_02775 [Candidatus Nomurabacteria bacterium RIFCSPLOWO2_01_FULL_37_49]
MNLDLSKIKKVFFIGIGGIGISAIARMMLMEGKQVFGSDISASGITTELENLGANITLGQAVDLIPKGVDLIVYSIAIPKYDPEFFKKLQSLGLKLLNYPEILGIVTADKYAIAVSGTHGKTTTTAMIAKILIDAGRDPSVIVGSLLKDYKSNLVVGKSEFFVVEACEYERSFLNIKPKILVITNIEPDHLDYYKDIEDIKNAFWQLILQTENVVIYNGNDTNISTLAREYKGEAVDYIKYLEKVPKLSVPGEHNRMNAAAALAVADILGIKEEISQKSLAEFSGTWRRLEKKGETKEGTIIYDDYAHHPTEIKASLQALRELYPKSEKKITVLFQPHLYSRTKALFDDFAKSFKDADKVLLLPIYFAREAKDESVSSEKLVNAINKTINKEGDDARAYPDFKSAENAVVALKLGSKDIFVTMGAGEAYKISDKVLKFT